MKTRHPRWWQLYLAFPFLVALTVLTHVAHLSGWPEELIQIAFVIACFGLLALWLRANAGALLHASGPVSRRLVEVPGRSLEGAFRNEADDDRAA